MRLGTIYGPVGVVEREGARGLPKVVMFSTKWQDVQDHLNKAIKNGEGVLGPNSKTYAASDLAVLDYVLDQMSQGELSFSPDHTLTP